MRIVKTLSGTALVVAARTVDFGASRSSYIGGTDIAPIIGVSERLTRFAVWARKIHADLPEDKTNAEERDAGTFYEPYILRRFGQRFTNIRVHPTALTYRRRDAMFLGANPDGIITGPKSSVAIGGVDAKTRSPFMRSAWGDEGTANVPADELCQCQWYMEILDLPVWYLAVFFDRQLVVFVVPRDRDLGALMVEEATAFWHEYILPKKEPPFEGAAAKDYLRRKFPRVLADMREAVREDDALVMRREVLKRQIAALQTNLEAVEGDLKNRIGTAEGVRGTGYTARWYEIGARNGVDWKAVVAELRSFPVVADEETASAIREQIDIAIARYMTKSEPTRALKVTLKKGPHALPLVDLEALPATPAALPAAPTEGEEHGS